MSTNALEKALWQIGTQAADAEQFRVAPAAYVDRFNLDAEEKVCLVNLDVGEMSRRGTSTLLLMMGFMAIRGPQGMGDYMQSMHRSPQS